MGCSCLQPLLLLLLGRCCESALEEEDIQVTVTEDDTREEDDDDDTMDEYEYEGGSGATHSSGSAAGGSDGEAGTAQQLAKHESYRTHRRVPGQKYGKKRYRDVRTLCYKDPLLRLHFNAYIAISTVLSTLISGGLTALLTLLLYVETADGVKLWLWPDTVGGDILLTCVVGSLITWVLGSQLTLGDCQRKHPMLIHSRPQVKHYNKPAQWLTESHSVVYSRSMPRGYQVKWYGRLAKIMLAGLIVGLCNALFLGPIFIFVGGVLVMNDEWDLASLIVLKLILGALIALIVQPLVVATAGARADAVLYQSQTMDLVNEAFAGLGFESRPSFDQSKSRRRRAGKRAGKKEKKKEREQASGDTSAPADSDVALEASQDSESESHDSSSSSSGSSSTSGGSSSGGSHS